MHMYHTGNTYIITPNVFSVEALALINGIHSIFHNLCYYSRTEARFEIIILASVLLIKESAVYMY